MKPKPITTTKRMIRWLSLAAILGAATSFLAATFMATREAQPLTAGTDRHAWQSPLLDIDGHVHVPFDSPDCKAVVFVFMKTQCPVSNRSIPALNAIVAEFPSEQFPILSVNVDANVTREAIVSHRDEFAMHFPVLLSDSKRLRRELQPTHSPQAVVVTMTGDVVYSGAIDNRHVAPAKGSRTTSHFFLRDALQAVAAGKPVAVARTQPIGCQLEPLRPMQIDTEITYARDIAPIIQVHCVACHHDGDVAPFPLDTHEAVRRHASQIREVVADGSMPPWKPVGDHQRFRDDLRLTTDQVRLIKTWIDNGQPFGSKADLPAPREFSDGWRLGPPDLVLEMSGAFTVQADGNDIYRYFVLPIELSSSRLIAAVDFKPGNPQVVHHAGFWFDRTGMARENDRKQPGPGYTSFGGPAIPGWIGLGNWTPGTTPQRLPSGTGRLVPAGSDLVLQIHYHPSGRAESDQSKVGLYFADEDAKRQVAEIAVGDMTLDIPPGATQHEHKAEYTLPVESLLLDVYPHMHLLGRKISATAHLPNGEARELIRVEDWDYAWQPRYGYLRPVRLPAGTRIELVCEYDNSADNPYQPTTPPQRVYWGEGANDEMGLVYFQVLPAQDTDFDRLTSDNMRYYSRTLESLWRLIHQRRANSHR